MPEREIEPRRLVWVGPLTIICANTAVLTIRHVALMLVTRPARFAPLGVGPAVIDTTILVYQSQLIAPPAGTTTAIISSRSSCPITLLGMRRDCEGDRRDAQSTRVRSIGRGDGGLAGVGRLGSSVNHRLA